VSELHSGTDVCSRGEYALEEADPGTAPVQQHEIPVSHEAQVLACHPALAPAQGLDQRIDHDAVQDIHADGSPGLRRTILPRPFGTGAESRTDGGDLWKGHPSAVNGQNAQTAGTFEPCAGVVGKVSCPMQQFPEDSWLQLGTCFGDRALPDAARRIGVELFEERLGLLLDREQAVRETRRMKTRLRKAKLRQQGSVEDIDFRHPRGLDKSLVVRMADCQWIRKHNNLIITGPTGVGKSYLACAFAEKACREGFSALYLRMTKLFEDLSLAKGDGRYVKLLTSYAKTDLLVLDDYGLLELNQEQRHDLLEILEDRHGLKSTLVTSQLPVEHWHEQIGDPTLADAILDRLVHSAHKIKLKGESMRKKRANLT
jgi:DNA replication protein DnaC